MNEANGYSFGVIVILDMSVEQAELWFVKVTVPVLSALIVTVSNPLAVTELTWTIVCAGVPGVEVMSYVQPTCLVTVNVSPTWTDVWLIVPGAHVHEVPNIEATPNTLATKSKLTTIANIFFMIITYMLYFFTSIGYINICF
jgi:hypothetical protein